MQCMTHSQSYKRVSHNGQIILIFSPYINHIIPVFYPFPLENTISVNFYPKITKQSIFTHSFLNISNLDNVCCFFKQDEDWPVSRSVYLKTSQNLHSTPLLSQSSPILGHPCSFYFNPGSNLPQFVSIRFLLIMTDISQKSKSVSDTDWNC